MRVPEIFAPSVTEGASPAPPATGPWVSPMRNAAPGLLQQTGETLAQAGALETHLGNTIGDRVQETMDDANVRNANTQFLKAANDIATRYTHSLGKDAIDGYEPTAQALDKAAQDAKASLTNPVQQHMFTQMTMPRLVEIGKQLSDHQFQQHIQYGTQAFNDSADTAVQQAANNYADWQRPNGKFALNKALAVHEAQQAALLLGQPADSSQSQALVKQKTTALAQGVVTRMMDKEQYSEAQQFLDANKDEIDERHYEVLSNAVMEGHSAQKMKNLAEQQKQAVLGAADTSQQRLQPVAGGSITSTMGAPRPGGRTHDGIDIAVPVGTSVQAPANGTVTKVWNDDKFGGGLSMEISYPNGYTEGFAHLSSVNYKPGQQVTQGTVVALTGKSGNATGPVLHWAMKDKDGNWVDPRSVGAAPKNTEDFTEPEQLENAIAGVNASDANQRVKDGAIRQLKSDYATARALQDQKYQEVKQNVVDALAQNGGNYDAVPASLRTQLTPSDAQAFQQEHDDAERKAAEITLRANWIEHPAALTVPNVEEAYQKGQLTPGGYLSALKEAKARDADPERVRAVSVDNQQIENTLLENGQADIVNAKPGSDQQKEKVTIWTNIKNQIDVEQQAKGRALTRQEKQSVIDGQIKQQVFVERSRAIPFSLLGKVALSGITHVVPVVTPNDLHYGQPMPLGEVPTADLGKTYVMSGGNKVYLADIPAGRRMEYQLNRFRRGLPITEQGIADDWVHFGMPTK